MYWISCIPSYLKHIYAPICADSMRMSWVFNPAIVFSVHIYAVGINVLVNNEVHSCPQEVNHHIGWMSCHLVVIACVKWKQFFPLTYIYMWHIISNRSPVMCELFLLFFYPLHLHVLIDLGGGLKHPITHRPL
jgi:hypothetical protein